jgi:hypothetical protein
MKKIEESKALLEVWDWKESAYRKVAHLDLDAALKKRLADCIQTAKELNIPTGHASPQR